MKIKLKLGNLTLNNNLMLAPMAGLTNLPLRLWPGNSDGTLLYGNGKRPRPGT
jgi:tRNA-dihydrouridine synthase